MLKVVIIEDEKYTAIDLADTIKRVDSDIQILKTLPTIEEAVAFLKSEDKIDLIFSDIQLSDGLSFEIFKSVKLYVPIIFCTAYDKYALEAFETNGIDYLLKPFSKASVSKALDKYMTLTSKNSESDRNFNDLILKIEQQIKPNATSVIVYQGDKILPVELTNIALFYLEDKYVFAFTFDAKKYLITQNLEEMEKICGQGFFRVNRQYLVNRKAVKDASKYLNRKILVNLIIKYPEQILVGKLKNNSFLHWLTKN